MARKLRGFERVLDAPALFAVAYDEIGSSIYFALGIVAAQALGLTPVVLLATGLLFLLVSLSYAEGTAAIPETGGAATFTRRAFNDLVGFATGWVLLLDYLIVIALSTLFLPHYLGGRAPRRRSRDSPWDVLDRRRRRSPASSASGSSATRASTGPRSALALLDLVGAAARRACSASRSSSRRTSLTNGFDLAPGQGWHDLLFALPLAMLAYTGLETVANLAEETREPGKTLPRSLFSAIGLVVVIMTVLIAIVGVSAFPAEDGSTALGDEWLRGAARRDRRPRSRATSPAALVDMLRVVVGLSGRLDPLRRRDDLRSPGCTRLAPLDGRARDAAARVRPARAALARLAARRSSRSALVAIATVVGTATRWRRRGRSWPAPIPSASCSPSRPRSRR